MKNLVTRRQALWLRELGFNEPTLAVMLRLSIEDDFNKLLDFNRVDDYNASWQSLSVPTVDEAIDWLRRKFNVVIADKTIPFVDPKACKIMFAYLVKWCNLRDGWNGRVIIGYGDWSYNPYAAKRNAITIALRWLIKRRSAATGQQKVSNIKVEK